VLQFPAENADTRTHLRVLPLQEMPAIRAAALIARNVQSFEGVGLSL
jgi:hypothetical protein